MQNYRSYLIVLSIGFSTVVHAQSDGALITDRPSFSISPVSVQPGTIQIEGGGLWSQFAGLTTISGPEILGRVGILNKLEFRAALPNYIDVKNSSASGLTDITLGAKYQISDEGSTWAMAVIAQASIPTGDENLTADRVEPEIILTASTSIGESTSLGIQGGLKSVEVVEGNRVLYTGALIVSTPIAEKISAFGEVYLISRPQFDTDYVARFGLIYLISNDFQLDLNGGSAINENPVGAFIGFGGAFRL